MAQCHDYLDIKTVDVETNPECNWLYELLPAICLLTVLGVVLTGITLHAPVDCQRQ